ncbi:MAG: Gfo/Idh/MocA family oxidoreductase [Clostridia bacterium]|nr:Gfo/Idh/MocA family oxidoreductase [Clostridia bacterium]
MKRLKFGIVGTGNIAHRFASAIAGVPEAQLVAVASRTKENAEKFGDEFNIPFRFGSYEDMAKSPEIDIAYIAVPHGGHKGCSCLMMNSGKHVLCEKPMGINTREVGEITSCAEKNNVFLMEAMWARLVPGTLKMLDIIRDGTLGEIKSVEGKFCYAMDESQLSHHVLKNENGGGSLLDVGIYGLSFASWYLGRDVENITAFADTYNGVDSHTCMLLKYKNGGIADISSAVMLRKPNEGFIYGIKGYARLERFYAPEKIYINLNSGESFTIDTPYLGNGFEEQIKHVCDCISKGLCQSPVNSFEQTLFVTGQMDKIRKLIGISYPQD